MKTRKPLGMNCLGCRDTLSDHPKFGKCLRCDCPSFVRSLSALAKRTGKQMGLRRSNSLTTYGHRLWAIVSRYIRLKNADHAGMVTCVTCGAVKFWKEIHAGHYIPKKAGNAIRFLEKNIHPQCPRCNLRERGNLTKYAVFMVKTYGVEILDELDQLRHTTMQIREDRYLELIHEYTEKLKPYEALYEVKNV